MFCDRMASRMLVGVKCKSCYMMWSNVPVY